MPNLWDKTPEAPSPSELNPLTNPLLEQHLGRWARVYFGTPPAKREQAVSNLLEEIKRESAGGGRCASPVVPILRPTRNLRPTQNFSARFVPPAGIRIRPATNSAAGAASFSVRDSLARQAIWARQKFLKRFPQPSATTCHGCAIRRSAAWNDSNASPGRGWKYLAGAVMIVLAGLAYLHWAPEFRARVASTARTPQVSRTGCPTCRRRILHRPTPRLRRKRLRRKQSYPNPKPSPEPSPKSSPGNETLTIRL